MPALEQKAQQESPLEHFIHQGSAEEFSKSERLSKRLSRMGVCSRRMAERLIDQGMVRVDNQIVSSNVPVTSANLIQVQSTSKSGQYYTPVKEGTRLWLFHKPREMVTTHYDPQGRLTVFDMLRERGLSQHVISVGRLDYLSEGLMLITNDGELARALELPNFGVERSYRVRVFGRMFDEQKLAALRKGVFMSGRKYGPYVIEVENRQNTNTWLHIKMWEGKNNEIRRVMRKFSLRVNRLQRVRYGPYTLGQVGDPNSIIEVPIVASIRRIMHNYYRDRVQQAGTLVQEEEAKMLREKTKKAFKDSKKDRRESLALDDDLWHKPERITQ